MEISTLQQLIRANDATAIRRAFVAEWNSHFDPIDFLNYDPATHKIIRDRIYRQDKIFYREVPNEYDSMGQPVKEMRVAQVTRVAIPFQKEIVDTTVSFSVGGKITIDATPKVPLEEQLYEELKMFWRDNKMQYRIKDIARRLFSETECAVIMFADKNDDNDVELNLRIVSPSDGDVLYPIYNGKGKMIAFGFEYLTQDYKLHFDVYTKDYLFQYVDYNGFKYERAVPLDYGKLPVVYFNINESLWKKVQSLADRISLTVSNLCDTNDYNGSPILFGSGDIDGFSDKGETGKLITGQDGADLKYLTWDKAPESIKLELEILKEQIYTKCRIVDLSPQAIKGMGTAPSGSAFDRMLIAPHMLGQDMQSGSLGEGVQRLLNLGKSAICNLLKPALKPAQKLYVEPGFNLFRIDDLEDRITTMALAMPGKQLVALKTAVKYINATNNADTEAADIKAEEALATPFNNPTPTQGG